MSEIEAEHFHGQVVIRERLPDPAGKAERREVSKLSPADARHLASLLGQRAAEAEAYAAKRDADDIVKLEAEIKVRQDRLAELRRKVDAASAL